MRSAILACAMLLAATNAMPQESQRRLTESGEFWVGTSDAMKVMWVSGFLHGAQTASDLLREVTTAKTQRPQQSAGCSGSKAADFTHIQVGQFTSGLDAFYKDFRNTRIHVADAMILVRDEVSGCPAVLLEKEVLLYRQLAATKDYDD